MARPSASSDVFRAVADPTRRAVLDLLAEHERTAGELAREFDLCQSTVSEHLGVLRRAGLVDFRESGGRRTYALRPDSLGEIATWSARFGSDRAARATSRP